MTEKDQPDPKVNPIPGVVANALNSLAAPERLYGKESLPVQITPEELESIYGPDHPFATEPRVPHDLIQIPGTDQYIRRPCYLVHDRCPKCRTYTCHSIDGSCHNHTQTPEEKFNHRRL